MRFFSLLFVSLFLLGIALPTSASAQYVDPRPYDPRDDALRRPRYSPYLDLIRDPRVLDQTRYHRLVQPQFEFMRRQQEQQRRIEQLQQQQSLIEQQQRNFLTTPYIRPTANPITGAAQGLRPTGHPVSRMSYGGYFGR